MKKEDTIKHAREVLRIEAESILNLIDRLGVSFSDAVEMIFRSKGRVIVTGIGKSGLVGEKDRRHHMSEHGYPCPVPSPR